MEDLIGKKVKGFKFEGDYVPQMDKHIGEVGEIISVSLKRVRVQFNKSTWRYPADQIEKHLVKEVMKKFKIGDRVQCVEKGVVLKPSALGYKPGKEFVVDFSRKSSDGEYVYFPKDAQGVYECDLILVKTLPKSFACTNTNQKLWDKFIKWFDAGFKGDVYTYYGFDTDGQQNCCDRKDFYDTILSLEEWDEIVNGTEIKEIMETGKQIEKLYLTDKVMYIGKAFGSLNYGTYYNLIREFDNDYLVFDDYGNEIAIPKEDFADEATISKIKAEQKERAKNYMMLKDGYRLKEEALDYAAKIDNHYDNSNGSLYLFAQQQGLNSWEFDCIKRVVRCRKKGQFKEDLEKTIRVIELYLKEHES